MLHRSTLALVGAAAIAFGALPAIAHAQGTEEQQQACTPDALKLCSDTIPDIGKTTACMKAHYAQLTPRCQSAFHDATGGGKTVASHKAVETSRSRVAARSELPAAEHRLSERRPALRRLPERDARDAVPPREAEGDVPAVAAGYPPFPSPDAPLVRPATPRAQIADACRAGIIDSFTCSTTVPALLRAAGE